MSGVVASRRQFWQRPQKMSPAARRSTLRLQMPSLRVEMLEEVLEEAGRSHEARPQHHARAEQAYAAQQWRSAAAGAL